MGFVEGGAFSMIKILANGLLYRKGTSREFLFNRCLLMACNCSYIEKWGVLESGTFSMI